MIIFKVTVNQGFTFSLEDPFLEKPKAKWGKVEREGGGELKLRQNYFKGYIYAMTKFES